MGTRGLEIVRFRRRYYVRWHQFDSYFEGLGADIVARIPADAEGYNKWLESMRAQYAALEDAFEKDVYEIRDGVEFEDSSQVDLRGFMQLPSELLKLEDCWVEYVYVINLDEEVLTMNHSIHWKLGNIPREGNMWIRAIVDSVYPYKPTISLDVCPEEHMASPALELREPDSNLKYDFRPVKPRTKIVQAKEVFLTYTLANVFLEYKNEIVRFGGEWSPDSFPFRELTFALVSIASGQAGFHSFPGGRCNPRNCGFWDCDSKHLFTTPGWIGKEWVGDDAPLLEFGSMSHRPNESPGASPTETMYWHEDVLVSLALVVDGKAITEAITWGLEQGRADFQVVILSLFDVAFAEVFCADDGQPFVEVSDSFPLSPLRARYCVSTHPRERPEMKPGMVCQRQRGEEIMESNCTGSQERLQAQFPGLAALVNFFEAAAGRRAASKSAGILPLELYDLILDFVDYDTWKACLLVSTGFRSCCLRKFRLDDQKRIVADPLVRLKDHRHVKHTEPRLSFDIENMQTGEIIPMVAYQLRPYTETEDCNWMPVVGSDRKALMLEVGVQLKPDGDMLPEADSIADEQ